MKFKKWISLLLTSIILLSSNLGIVVRAATPDTANGNTLLSYSATLEMDSYANKIVEKHLLAALHSGSLQAFGLSSDNIADYALGNAFSVTDINTLQCTYFYPVLCNGNVDGLLQVIYDGEEYTSSLGKSFSEELMDLLMHSSGNAYQLYSDGNNLYAYNGVTMREIYHIYNNGRVAEKVTPPVISNRAQMKILSVQNLISTCEKNDFVELLASTPSSYKTINVAGVSQGDHPWCWAATCAAMINYYKGYSITASDVANFVFPDAPEQGGTWSNMQTAYNHWGLYPTQTGRISFSNVKSNINSNSPMHLGLTGHSVGLIGYEDWGLLGDNILILLEPNGGVRKTVTLKLNGNFDYYLCGSNAWNYTREF